MAIITRVPQAVLATWNAAIADVNAAATVTTVTSIITGVPQAVLSTRDAAFANINATTTRVVPVHSGCSGFNGNTAATMRAICYGG
jgi:hypothetical protein